MDAARRKNSQVTGITTRNPTKAIKRKYQTIQNDRVKSEYKMCSKISEDRPLRHLGKRGEEETSKSLTEVKT